MEPWMKEARKCLGIRETPGKKHTKAVLDFFAEAGFPEIKDDETAWCAAFVNAMLSRAGYTGTGSLAARSFLKYGDKLEEPKKDCIVVLKRGNSDWQGHVGFFVRKEGPWIYVLSGNQKNEVNTSAYHERDWLGYRWPTQRKKSLAQSKIATGAVSLAGIETLDTAVQISDHAAKLKENTDRIDLFSLITPRIGLSVLLVCIALVIIYWRWRDYGRGAK